MVPHGVAAAGWVPFTAASLVAVLFSWALVTWYRHRYASALGTVLVSTLAVSLSLLSAVLIPTDVFLASYMKTENGTFKDWAANLTARQEIEDTVLYAYYALYGLVLLFIFIVLPFVYFFLEEKDETTACFPRCCSSLKFTIIFIFLAGILIVVGAVIPLKDPPPADLSNLDKFRFIINELENNKGEDILSFAISCLSTLGLGIFIAYGGLGLAFLPFSFIKGRRSLTTERDDLEERKASIQGRINSIQSRNHVAGSLSARDQSRLNDLEVELMLLNRQSEQLSVLSKSWLRTCSRCLQPVRAVLGFTLLLVSILVWVSLLLTNIDKALHSLGPTMGYALPAPQIPNPIDAMLVVAQRVFPLDYVAFLAVVLFLFLCVLSAIGRLGIWFLWIRVYRIRAQRTLPQALLLLSMILMLAVLALAIVVYLLTPQYMMFGNQKYFKVGNNTTELVPCSTEADENDCTASRAAMLISRFCYKAWIFGVFYYWGSWLYLTVALVGFALALFMRRASNTDVTETDELEEDDDDLIRA